MRCWEALKLVAGVEDDVREWWLPEGFGILLGVVSLGVERFETVSMAMVGLGARGWGVGLL